MKRLALILPMFIAHSAAAVPCMGTDGIMHFGATAYAHLTIIAAQIVADENPGAIPGQIINDPSAGPPLLRRAAAEYFRRIGDPNYLVLDQAVQAYREAQAFSNISGGSAITEIVRHRGGCE